MSDKATILTVTVAILALSTFSFIPVGPPTAAAATIAPPFSWNPQVPCTPLVVRITDITANQTGSASFAASPFSPGTTPPVSGGDSKRWLTPGATPPGWISPGPSCTVTNSKGTTSLFVEIDGVERNSLTNEDWSNLYDPTNGGTSHSLLTGDTTFNLFDPNVVPDYSTSCTSASDPTCYGRIHTEIDHDWKAAGYCGPGTVCDNATLAAQTSPTSTLIDVQGFVYWDAGAVAADWHQFNGWELHPLTAWKVHGSPPPAPFTITASSKNPQVGQAVTFTATPLNGTTAASFSWNFGDGVTTVGSSVSHIFVTAQTFTVYATMTRSDGASFTTWVVVSVGSWNQNVACAPALTTLEGVIGGVSIQRTPSNSSTAGADYSGGGFRLDGNLPYGSNPTTWPFFRRDLQPPCSVNGTSAFVEFHNVTVINLSKDNCGTTYQNGTTYPNGWQSCDTTFTLVTPGWGDDATCPACYMHRVYAGIDRDWNASGIAPPPPKEGQRIDVQGFVFWNNVNVNATWHSYSGWEIHPISSWRITHLPIIAGISFSPSNPTSAQTVTFNGTGSGGTGPYTFNWDFGDGTLATGNATSHTYPPGTYTVHLSVTDSLSMVGTGSQNVTVRIPPDFTLTVNPNSVSFTAGSTVSSSVNLTSIHEFSGNVSLTTQTSPGITGSFSQTTLILVPESSASSTLTFSSLSPGTYTVTVVGLSGLLSHSANVTITVVDVGPTVGFSESRNTAFRDQTIAMTISSSDIDGTVTSLSVNWGDGVIDTLAGNATSDSHAYAAAGTFTVNVTATDNAGLSSTATGTNTISDSPPIAGFNQSPTTAPTGTLISFNASTSSDPDGTIVDYLWSFGDGSIGSGPTITHSYDLAGNYTVTLTVTDNATLTTSVTSMVQITDRPPLASLTASSTNAPTGTTITLYINATDPDGSVAGVIVTWGDGRTDILPGNTTTDSHSYSLAGSYSIYVNATDNSGLTTMSRPISLTINDRPPVVEFIESATNAPTGTSITMTISATDPDGIITGIRVNWGDGTTDSLLGNATTDSHSYALAGSYTVSVNASDDAGLTGSSQSINTISDRPPSLSFTEDNTSVPTGTAITLTISASDPDGTISQVQVAWGDGTADLLPGNTTMASHSYALAGSYMVNVTVTDDAALTSSSQATNTITDRPPTVAFTQSATDVPTGTTLTVTIEPSDPDGTVTNIAVTWGDGTIDELPGNATSDSHSYSLAGSYAIFVNATDNAGLTTSSMASVNVTDRPASISFAGSAGTAPTGAPITLTIIASDPDGTVTSLRVDWGDGTNDNLPGNTTTDGHSYALAGTYTIVVTAMDNAGLTSSSEASILITDRPPSVTFTTSPDNASTGTPIVLNINATDLDGTVTGVTVNWGDGTIQSLTGNITSDSHSYATAGSYTITVTATDDAGLTGSSQSIVAISDRPPIVSLTATATTIPTGAPVTLTISASDPDGTLGNITVSWGDGTIVVLPGNATSDSHTYSLAGFYSAYVNSTDNSGSTTKSEVIIFTVSDRPPIVSFTESSTTVPTGTNVILTISASDPDGSLTSISIAWGDGTVDLLAGNATSDSHSYVLAGLYNLYVNASDDANLTTQSSISSLTITDRPPVLTFTQSASTAFRDQAVTVTISSSDPDGTVTSLSVDWGDGTVDLLPGNSTTDSHAYITAGTFMVNVTATDNAGLSVSITALNTIADAPPVAAFTQTLVTAPTGTTISFDGSTSSDSDGTIVNYSWNFGDGSTANGINISHSYSLAGNYTVTLTVTDNATLTASTTTLVHVLDRPPMLSLAPSTTSSPTGTSISLSINATDPDGSIMNITIVWGDGTIDSLPVNVTSSSHAYSLAGSYNIYVNATDNAGLTTTSATITMNISDRPPVISFSESAPTVRTGTPITLTMNATDPDGTVTSIMVNWGDGTVDSLAGNTTSDAHSYNLAGSYAINVTATDNAGLSGSSETTITVSDRPPIVGFTQSSTIASSGTLITLTVSASDPDGTVAHIQVSWGDGIVDTLAGNATADSHSYHFAGSYTIVVTAIDDASLSADSQATMTVTDRPPAVTFTGSASTVPTGSAITLTINATDPDGTISAIGVSWGDGTVDILPANATAATHSYSTSGTYSVYVNATDDANLTTQSSVSSLTVTDRPPVINLTESSSTAFRDQVVTLAISSSDPDGTVTSLRVDWGDGTVDILPSNSTTDTHAYAVAGTFTINATATDNNGLASTTTTVETVTDVPPTVSLTASPGSVNTGQTVTLTISSQDLDGTVTQTVIAWGDGTINTLTGAPTIDTHAYASTGNAKSQTFTVSVTVTDNATLTATSTALVTVNDVPPTALITPSTTSALTGESISFNATANDADGSITIYTWNFGDGSTGTGIVVTHSYASTGNNPSETFNVTLTVTDNSGNTVTAVLGETITDRNPVASFTQSTQATLTESSVTFNATGSADPDGSVLTYSWNFGDGATATGLVVTHSYANTGNSLSQDFTISLTVTDNSGNAGGASAHVIVNDRPPAASFTQSSSSTSTGASVEFNASSSVDPDGNILSYTWSFGDGTNGTGETVVHEYPLAGNYTISLMVTDNSGSQTSETANVTVFDRPPVAVLSSSSTTSLTLSTISFNATGSFDPDGSVIGYAWNFGDGTTGSGFSATHSYATSGNYTVVLGVTDNIGLASFSSVVEIILDRAPTASFTFAPNGPVMGHTVSYDASSSNDPDGTVVSYAWDFGDGSPASFGIMTSHIYPVNGSYTVTLTILDDHGASATAVTTIPVGQDVTPPSWDPSSSLSISNMQLTTNGTDVSLSWTPAADDGGIAWYSVYVNGSLSATVRGNTTVYTVNGLGPASYKFTVEAVDYAGLSSSNGPSTTIQILLASSTPQGGGYRTFEI